MTLTTETVTAPDLKIWGSMRYYKGDVEVVKMKVIRANTRVEKCIVYRFWNWCLILGAS
jgi:hypothetical protein